MLPQVKLSPTSVNFVRCCVFPMARWHELYRTLVLLAAKFQNSKHPS